MNFTFIINHITSSSMNLTSDPQNTNKDCWNKNQLESHPKPIHVSFHSFELAFPQVIFQVRKAHNSILPTEAYKSIDPNGRARKNPYSFYSFQ